MAFNQYIANISNINYYNNINNNNNNINSVFIHKNKNYIVISFSNKNNDIPDTTTIGTSMWEIGDAWN